MFNYKSGTNLESELTASINANANFIKKDKMLKYVDKLGDVLSKIGEKVGGSEDPYTKAFGIALQVGGYWVKYFASSAQSPIAKATKTALALSGTVSKSSLSGITKADIATPGSWNVKNRTGEYSPDPEYPLYNESMGVIAFLTKPKVKYFEHFEGVECDEIGPVSWITNAGQKKMFYTFDPASLKFKFNPIVDVKEYFIDVALEFKLIINEDKTEGVRVMNGEVYSVKNTEESSEKVKTISSPMISLNCSGNLTSGVDVADFNSCNLSFDGYYEALLEEPTLKVIVRYTSNKHDRNGRNISGILLYSLPLEVQASATIGSSIVENPAPFNEGGIPMDLVLGNHTFNSNYSFDKIYAHHSILLNGAIINNQISNGSPKQISFIAGQELEFLPGLSTGGTSPMEFSIGSVYEQNCPPSSTFSELSNAFVTSFCKKQNPLVNYGANQAFSRFGVASDDFIPPISSATTLGYPIPNPTQGECSLSFNLAEESGYAIQLSNVLGETVRVLAKSEFAKTGPQSITFNTDGLEAGVYFITFTSNGFRQARKLVVVR